MATRYVVDTNVLVYALDRREPEKRERAREVLRCVGGAGTAALPAQVLSEFGGACLRKLESRPDPDAIRREVERLMLAFPILPLTGPWCSRPCGASGSTCSPSTTPRDLGRRPPRAGGRGAE
jgi:predicted nucleic acid-binding protein